VLVRCPPPPLLPLVQLCPSLMRGRGPVLLPHAAPIRQQALGRGHHWVRRPHHPLRVHLPIHAPLVSTVPMVPTKEVLVAGEAAWGLPAGLDSGTAPRPRGSGPRLCRHLQCHRLRRHAVSHDRHVRTPRSPQFAVAVGELVVGVGEVRPQIPLSMMLRTLSLSVALMLLVMTQMQIGLM
jgi:hypothetical protein